MELFDFIKVIFTDPTEFGKVTPGEKRKNFFMLNRRFAINFPAQANALQLLKINQSAVIDFWQNFLRKQYKYVPGWMYTKGMKKSQEVKEKKMAVTNAQIIEYCKFMKLDIKTVKDALEFYPLEMTKEIKDFIKVINQK